MSKRTRRMVSILLTLSLLVALLVPMAAPAGARSVNGIDRVASVTDNWTSSITHTAVAVLTLKEDGESWQNDFRDGDRFRLTLKSGLKWVDTMYNNVAYDQPFILNNTTATTPGVALQVDPRSETNLEIAIPNGTAGPTGNDDVDSLTIPLYIDVNSIVGDLTITIENIDSAVTPATYTFANSKSTKTASFVESVKNIGKTDNGGLIRIDEVAPGALAGKQTLKLKLPAGFEWNGLGDGPPDKKITGGGGFTNKVLTEAAVVNPGDYWYSVEDAREQTAEITFVFAATTSRGSIYIDTPIRATNGAAFGDVEVALSGSDVFDSADLLIAKYMNWGVDFTVKSVKDLSAGKLENITTDTIKIEENVSGTLLNGRELTITLPDWVKVTDMNNIAPSPSNVFDFGGSDVGVGQEIDGTSNEINIPIGTGAPTSGSTLAKMEFRLDITIEANKTGDIEATISGSGIEPVSLVIANAIAPVTATVDQINEVKIGVQSQDVADVYITEEIAGASLYRTARSGSGTSVRGGLQGYITLTAPDGVKFASTPTAEVTEGNLTLKAGAKLANNSSGISETVFQIPVDSDSTRPSTVKISNIKVTVDRTYPEGDIQFRVGGTALVDNLDTLWQPSTTAASNYLGWVDRAFAIAVPYGTSTFTTGTVVRVKVANCVTPAPGEVMTTDTIFTIGSTSYTVNGVEQTMDIAPYIKDDRTFIPLRFVARATGVSDENILFNQEYQTVTLIKGDRVVVTTIGSNILQVNGAAITMDTAPELVDPPGRTMFPIRWVATALGCNVDWDPDTQEVRIY